MDNKDFVFINKIFNEKEEKAFSDFLKNRKTRTLRVNGKKNSKKTENQ